jgi:cytoskeletal protein RodZ
MASVAEQLRTARDAQGLTVQQIAEITNVRADHIRAIEEGNYDVFSAPVYIRGFVRTYCKILKLDGVRVLADLNAELNRTEKFSEPPPLSDEPRTIVDWVTLQFSKIDWRKAGIGLAVAVVLAGLFIFYLIWRNQRTSDPTSGMKPGVYRPAGNRGDTLPLPPPQQQPPRR